LLVTLAEWWRQASHPPQAPAASTAAATAARGHRDFGEDSGPRKSLATPAPVESRKGVGCGPDSADDRIGAVRARGLGADSTPATTGARRADEKASAISFADAKRASGDRANAFAIHWSIAGPSCGRCDEGGGIGRLVIPSTSSLIDSASKARTP